MNTAIQQAMNAMEVLDHDKLKEAFKAGLDPNQVWEGSTIGHRLVDMYLRGPRFPACARVILDQGWLVDPLLASVLTDDDAALTEALVKDPSALHHRYSFRCTFTPLEAASLLHICAEYNLPRCARVLLEAGMDVNVRAGVDEDGLGGHTPVFHTVNQHQNNSLPMLQLLLEHQADLAITVKGLVWGKGYDWETFIPSVNPVSYAMMGLLPQFQRDEVQIYTVVDWLMRAAYGVHYTPKNIPNRYLQ